KFIANVTTGISGSVRIRRHIAAGGDVQRCNPRGVFHCNRGIHVKPHIQGSREKEEEERSDQSHFNDCMAARSSPPIDFHYSSVPPTSNSLFLIWQCRRFGTRGESTNTKVNVPVTVPRDNVTGGGMPPFRNETSVGRGRSFSICRIDNPRRAARGGRATAWP